MTFYVEIFGIEGREMTKILFFDVDGTLYDSEKKLPNSAKLAVKEAKANGYEIAIATGRAPFMIEPLLRELEIDTYVSFNGQYVVYKGKVIWSDGVDNETLREIITFGQSRNEPVVFLDEKEMIASIDLDTRIDESLATLKYPYPRIDATFYQEQPVYQTLVFVTEEDEHLYKTKFPNVQFVRWHPYSCDVLPKHGSKARGIEKLLTHMGKTFDDAIAFGDGLNDIEMIQAVGTGVVMSNGHEKTLVVADIIAPHVDEDGIAKVMKEMKIIS